MTAMIESAEKAFKTTITNMFKYLRKNKNRMRRKKDT